MIRITLVVLFLAALIASQVNFRNGNFYLELMDFLMPTGGKALEVKRIYNSRSTHFGAFGYGWSFNFDIKLQIFPGGHAVIIDEDGRKILLSTKNSKKLYEQDLKNLQKKKKDRNLIARLRKERDIEEVGKVFTSAGIKPYSPNGTIYVGYGGSKGYETVKRVSKGWVRVVGYGGIKQLFSNSGQLIKVEDNNGNWVKLTYKGKRLHQIRNSYNRSAKFTWTSKGYIATIKDMDGKTHRYKYDTLGRLIDNIHPKFGKTQYRYNDRYHNLVQITYPDRSTKFVTYNDKKDIVTGEKGPGKLDVQYAYGTDPRDKKHYWTNIQVRDGNGAFRTIDRWEYWEDQDKYVRIKNGLRITTKFSKFGSGSPEYIDRGGARTYFKYNRIGQVVERILPNGKKIKTTYDSRVGKPSKVVDGKLTYYYRYNRNGNIVTARNNKGLEVDITYDERGRINTLHNNKKGTLVFKFNEMGRPTRIEKKKVGRVNIWYDTTGKISKIKAERPHLKGVYMKRRHNPYNVHFRRWQTKCSTSYSKTTVQSYSTPSFDKHVKFGEYLQKQGFIDTAMLVNALYWQNSGNPHFKRPKLGGYFTSNKIFNDLQLKTLLLKHQLFNGLRT